MGNVILIYFIIQLLSTAYGISVIETVKPIVNKKLVDDGYVLKNRNSMYKFNEGLINFAKGLIPFYYALKAVKLVKGSDAIEREAINQIKKGNYITTEEAIDEMNAASAITTEDKNLIKVNSEPVIEFEKPEKYTARRNDFELLESHEEEIRYVTTYETKEEKLSITPFVNDKTKTVIKEVTKKDIVNAIMDLNPYELDQLRAKLQELSEIKRKQATLRLKDVA